MRLIYLVAAVAATSAVPLLAAAQETDNRSKMVCKIIKATGTRLGRDRVCRTQSEWDIVDAETRRSVDKAAVPSAPGN